MSEQGQNTDVAYSVELAEPVAALPVDIVLCLRDAVAEIASVIAALPPGSSAVNVFRGERMFLDLMGRRFDYIVDPERCIIRVVSARDQPSRTA